MKLYINISLITAILNIYQCFAQTTTYNIERKVDVRSALSLRSKEYGIKGDASGGNIIVEMYNEETNLNGLAVESKVMYGCKLESNSGDNYVEQGYPIDKYFPWYCYIGFCRGDNADYLVDIESNDRRHAKRAIFACAQYYWYDAFGPYNDVDDINSVTSRYVNVKLRLTVSNINPCKIQAIKLPGIELCITDFIPDLISQCQTTCYPSNVNASTNLNFSNFETSNKNVLIIYPNPSSGDVTILTEVKNTGPTVIQIIDLNGRVVYKKTIALESLGSHQVTLNNTGLKNGQYIIKVSSKVLLHTGKLMIIK